MCVFVCVYMCVYFPFPFTIKNRNKGLNTWACLCVPVFLCTCATYRQGRWWFGGAYFPRGRRRVCLLVRLGVGVRLSPNSHGQPRNSTVRVLLLLLCSAGVIFGIVGIVLVNEVRFIDVEEHVWACHYFLPFLRLSDVCFLEQSLNVWAGVGFIFIRCEDVSWSNSKILVLWRTSIN